MTFRERYFPFRLCCQIYVSFFVRWAAGSGLLSRRPGPALAGSPRTPRVGCEGILTGPPALQLLCVPVTGVKMTN